MLFKIDLFFVYYFRDCPTWIYILQDYFKIRSDQMSLNDISLLKELFLPPARTLRVQAVCVEDFMERSTTIASETVVLRMLCLGTVDIFISSPLNITYRNRLRTVLLSLWQEPYGEPKISRRKVRRKSILRRKAFFVLSLYTSRSLMICS